MSENQNVSTGIKKIKSTIILKKILSLLWHSRKMCLLRYNKQLQKRLYINLDDYKNMSNRYKIGEKNGKGIEYYIGTELKLFEGEYSNGERNGKGKEYNKYGGIQFEGEYLNGERISGKEYNNNGNIILKIENGQGEEYFNNGKIRFKGEYNNGRK